ncbi:hypothetical protein ET495_07595 [Xylanimonas allomyrinae]|uniref:DUF7973 domain-containing protein n=1 Tax=Xylanimonas allomyrinae TaxID=2509459 RepID=A0A4V0YEN2_9MICO|nr:hypothetical protein ET495_07595 [Xylanimonas allomyrinae]
MFENLDISGFFILASLAGGFLGAAIGANFAFGLTGITVLLGLASLAGTGSTAVLDYIAFGPFTGPHVAFAGGVAAAAYAAKRGYCDDGKDATTPLARLGKPDVLLVGALFGAGGYIVQTGIFHLPWFGAHTDPVALTVVISAIVARVAFGKSRSLFDLRRPAGRDLAPRGLAAIAPDDKFAWVRYQERPAQFLTLGLFSGAAAAGASLWLHDAFPAIAEAGTAHVFPFAISAVTIIFLILGAPMPVTHHMTITGALAAVTFLPIVGHNVSVALLIGAAAGALAAAIGELCSRGMHIRGTTHFDPPAAAIWPTTTVILGLGAALGG